MEFTWNVDKEDEGMDTKVIIISWEATIWNNNVTR